ncbi:hypothetical protein AM2_074 [Lactococcus phage AM2]|uniref:Uncharacterized protein n=7 Tax=Audreyjarvisvirus AM1 TaxID=2845188 RepID=A0A1W6JLK8_9CAUD|nr:hypothetical protein H1Z30_gp075 [Lactococcus phage AM1]ARM66379.1 hypothetical protein AM2_074 [Lactococcus phage AM2]ARM66556.1 hypothetical protein AM3_074 [Lactococcus phage AM3]ARM67109.1 hypothetical protein AM8_074 [Lactococcus phage AM8]ARM67288.1 hypothetical protein AM9_075 [Lactococcus phage AM9]ARM67466.1 hypothetical protein AM11_074 [Lactococcus phage AM11]ARQ95654.1 hypothetical protein AM12_075 [Lactococcus phage AM12]
MNKLIEKYILTIIALVLDVLAMVITIVTLSLSWNHFIVPDFNVPKLGFLLTFAIVVMWELFDFRVTNTGITTILSKTTDTPNEQIAVDYAVTNVMVSLTIALVLLVLSLFI